MNVLVTGGAGYIGSHTAKELARNGHRPIIIDDLSTGHAHNVKWGPLVRANISDTAVVRRLLEEHRIEAVVHFAGSALVGESGASLSVITKTMSGERLACCKPCWMSESRTSSSRPRAQHMDYP